jgi:hypothetical protein
LNQTLDTFTKVYGSAHFDVRDPCNEKRSQIFCQKSTKFSNLVLAFGTLIDGTEGYIAFRLKDDQTLERVTDGMPWNLNTNGSMEEDFWRDNGQRPYYYGMTFDGFDFSDSLYISVPISDKLYKKKIDENGQFSSKWTEVEFGDHIKASFKGLFDVNGKLYGIGSLDDIYYLIRNDENKIIQTKEVSFAHKFLSLNSLFCTFR